MKVTNPWITYRTRFVVSARQLTTTLTFTDALGRQHAGHPGDYLVESDGVLRIQPRQIFEDIYVPLSQDEPASPVLRAQPTFQPRPPRRVEQVFAGRPQRGRMEQVLASTGP
jgi:hypothetical protein